MQERPEVPVDVLGPLRAICLALPDAHEEPAWVGTRWRIRTKSFAHVVPIEDGWPPAYARACGRAGPALVLMIRSAPPELDVLRNAGDPFFAPPWRRDEVGLVLGPDPDWAEIAELCTESYCVQAPAKLRALVARSGA
jgi:hypothetical protein